MHQGNGPLDSRGVLHAGGNCMIHCVDLTGPGPGPSQGYTPQRTALDCCALLAVG